MPQQPTYRTAALAGVISAVLSPIDDWLNRTNPKIGHLQQSAIWLSALIAFFIVPFYFGVLGRIPIVKSRLWMLDPEQRGSNLEFAKRAAIWLFSTVCVGTLLGAISWLVGHHFQ